MPNDSSCRRRAVMNKSCTFKTIALNQLTINSSAIKLLRSKFDTAEVLQNSASDSLSLRINIPKIWQTDISEKAIYLDELCTHN